MTVHLGYEVGTGKPVEIPLAHTFVTGQTQLSGKTTALRAIVERSGQRALAFVTKRGESFDGRRIRPYLPREGDRPIHWRLVETILASALGQRSMKYERLWLINAVKRPSVATTLTMVRGNVAALLAKAKGNSADVYTLIGEYLDLVLPDMRTLNASDTLDLQPGLNVMDLMGVSQQLQALVIRAALEQINRHEAGILTVFPEAWEFAPRATAAPAKEEAIAMARKGAVLKNFLLCDSQDIAGVDTVIRQAASVWLLGVQRELNEVKRTLQMIPAGVKRPKADDVAQLQLGQFYACWGTHAVKVYVQPAWMNAAQARQVADGSLDIQIASKLSVPVGTRTIRRRPPAQEGEQVNAAEAQKLQNENAALRGENADLRRRLERLESDRGDRSHARSDDAHPRAHEDAGQPAGLRSGPAARASVASGGSADEHREAAAARGWSLDTENLYRSFKARLIEEAPTVFARIVKTIPEIEVALRREKIEMDKDTLVGRMAILIADGFFDARRGNKEVLEELAARGWPDAAPNVSKAFGSLMRIGFLRQVDKGRYAVVEGMKVNVIEAA